MEIYEVNAKIEKLREERGWTAYKLAEEACVAQSTLFNMRTRGTLPSLTTLSCICDAFGITLADFFSDGQTDYLMTEERELLSKYRKLSHVNKRAVNALVCGLEEK